MSLIFPGLEAWDGATGVVHFPACPGGRAVLCGITVDALRRHFDLKDGNPLQCFLSHRDEIEGEALRLLCLNRLEPDGSLLIRDTDLPGRRA
jgi:hypothetical protein